MRVRRDRGQFYLYRACGLDHAPRYLITERVLKLTISAEEHALPIRKFERTKRGILLTFDTSSSPPFVPRWLRFLPLKKEGLFEVADESGGKWLMMNPRIPDALARV